MAQCGGRVSLFASYAANCSALSVPASPAGSTLRKPPASLVPYGAADAASAVPGTTAAKATAMIATVFTPMLLVLPVPFAGPAGPPAPDVPLPRTTAALVADFQRTDSGLRRSLGVWRRTDPALAAPTAPPAVQLWALRQQRLL